MKARARIPLLATTVDQMLAERVRILRGMREPRDRLRCAAALMADIVEASENMQAAQLELLAAINVPTRHADKGR